MLPKTLVLSMMAAALLVAATATAQPAAAPAPVTTEAATPAPPAVQDLQAPAPAVVPGALAAPVPTPPPAGLAAGASEVQVLTGQVLQLRQAVKAKDWGMVVSIGLVLLIFGSARFLVPKLHGSVQTKVAAFLAAWATYAVPNGLLSGTLDDVVWQVLLGAMLAGVAVWSAPSSAAPPNANSSTPVSTGSRLRTGPRVGLGTLLGLLVLLAACIMPQVTKDRLTTDGFNSAGCLAQCGLSAAQEAGTNSIVGTVPGGSAIGAEALACAEACAMKGGLQVLYELATAPWGGDEPGKVPGTAAGWKRIRLVPKTAAASP